jgi:hypothetical protein
LRAFLGGSTRPVLLRAFVPLITAAALINSWINATLPTRIHVNPAVTSALCAVVFAALIAVIISQISSLDGGRIDRAEAARNIAQAELLALNAHLETKVQERTRELRAKNQQMEEELQMARELQLALLPQKFPTVPAHVPAQDSALRFLSLYFPTGDVSSDFFNVFPIGERAVGIFICDVMGHGVRSALITSMIRGLVEEHGQAAADPGELLSAGQSRSCRHSPNKPTPPCSRPVFMSWPMSSVRNCVLLTPDIRPPFTFSTEMELRRNFRATGDPVRPWEFFQPPVTSRQAVR